VRPEQVPPGPLLVDTDVVSLLALEEERADEFAALVQGHELFVCFVTVAEIETFLRLGVLNADQDAAVRAALAGYSRLEVVMDDVVERWAVIRSATRTTMSRKTGNGARTTRGWWPARPQSPTHHRLSLPTCPT
jgi:predicted nucleic acid-binding protein